MRHEYTDKTIKIFNGMFTETINEHVDWDELCVNTLSEVKTNLFEFENDTQRMGYLFGFLKSLSDNGKEHWLLIAEKRNQNLFESTKDYEYVNNCLCCRSQFITDISEYCIFYKGIKYGEILRTAGIKTNDVYITKETDDLTETL